MMPRPCGTCATPPRDGLAGDLRERGLRTTRARSSCTSPRSRAASSSFPRRSRRGARGSSPRRREARRRAAPVSGRSARGRPRARAAASLAAAPYSLACRGRPRSPRDRTAPRRACRSRSASRSRARARGRRCPSRSACDARRRARSARSRCACGGRSRSRDSPPSAQESPPAGSSSSEELGSHVRARRAPRHASAMPYGRARPPLGDVPRKAHGPEQRHARRLSSSPAGRLWTSSRRGRSSTRQRGRARGSERARDAPADQPVRRTRRGFALELDVAAVWRVEARDEVEDGRLAGRRSDR